MTLLKNALLIVCIYSGLIWLYCVARIFTGSFSWDANFIEGVPVSFLNLSILSFVISGTSGFLYLVARESL